MLNDDRVGRSLDALFDADRASLLTNLVLKVIDEFDIELSKAAQRLYFGNSLRGVQAE